MKLYFEAKSKRMKTQHIDPYTMEMVDVYKYKGFEIDDTANGFCVFYCGDDLYFPTLEEAEEFIDGEMNESLKEDIDNAGFKDVLDKFKYLAYHRTKGMTKRQEYDLQDACDAFERKDFDEAYRIAYNIYSMVNKGLRQSVYYDLGDIVDEIKRFRDEATKNESLKKDMVK